MIDVAGPEPSVAHDDPYALIRDCIGSDSAGFGGGRRQRFGVDIRYSMDPETRVPHTRRHGVAEDNVEDVL